MALGVPVQAASYSETPVDGGILAEFESDLNPSGILGTDIWGWCYSIGDPAVFPQSEPGQGTNYVVAFGCEEGRPCVDGNCRDVAWDQVGCSIEASAATGSIYWKDETIVRQGFEYYVVKIDFGFNALSYFGSC